MRATYINNNTPGIKSLLSRYMSENDILNTINSKFINNRWPISISYVEDCQPIMANINGIGGGSSWIGRYCYLYIIIKDNYGQEHKNLILSFKSSRGGTTLDIQDIGNDIPQYNYDISIIFNNDLKQLCDYDIKYNNGERSQDLIYTMSNIIIENKNNLEE